MSTYEFPNWQDHPNHIHGVTILKALGDDIDFSLWLCDYWREREAYWKAEARKELIPHPELKQCRTYTPTGICFYSMSRLCEMKARNV